MSMPAAKGLFRSAIAQSGACSTARTRESATATSEGILRQLNLDPRNDVDKILAIEPAAVTAAAARYAAKAGGMLYGPCIDGDILPRLPLDAIRDGSADDISVMIGTNRDEWSLFLALAPSFELDGDALISMLAPNIADPRIVIDAYRDAHSRRGAPTDPMALLVAIETDRVFRLPSIHLSEVLAGRGRSSYQYLFTWDSPYGRGDLGSCHAVEIGFVFDTHAISLGSQEFFGTGADVDRLTDEVQDAWLAFVRTGKPTTPALSKWTPYEPQTRTTAIFGKSTEIDSGPLDEERAIWSSAESSLGTL